MKLVAFPFHDWRKVEAEGNRTRDGHLIEHFVADGRVEEVLIVDRPSSMAERLARGGAPRARGEVLARTSVSGGGSATLTRAAEGVLVLDIATADLLSVARRRRGWWFDVFGRSSTIDTVRWAIEKAGFENAPGIAWTPTVASTVVALGLRPFVFDSLDNWLIHPELRRHAADARAAYSVLLPYADRVFTSAPASAAALHPWTDRIEIVSNGVDPTSFSQTAARPPDLPAGPIVGYAGKLAQRIDVAMCREVAARLPGVTFVFMGPILHSSVRRLANLSNVRLLGDRHPSVLPAYVRHFELAWIPHRVGEGETGGDPIKLYEYWAADKQVVTTSIDGSERWRDRAFVVGSPSEAVDTISGLLAGSIEPKPVWVEPERTWGDIARRVLEPLTDPSAR